MSDVERAQEILAVEASVTPTVPERTAIVILTVITVAVAVVCVALSMVAFYQARHTNVLQRELSCRARLTVDLNVAQVKALSLKMDLDASTARALLYSATGDHDRYIQEVQGYERRTEDLDKANQAYKAAAGSYAKQLEVCRQ